MLESERNNTDIILYLDAKGSTRLSEDPTFGDQPRNVDPDPAFGFDGATVYLSAFDDDLKVYSEATAGDWVNQAVSYGLRGGNTKVDKLLFDEVITGSNLRGLRPTLLTYEGDDNVLIFAGADNTGKNYSVPSSSDAVAGKQRAVGLFQAVVDLGSGKDTLEVVALAKHKSNDGVVGATSIADSNDFFGGRNFTTKDERAAAALSIYESAVFAGSGDDMIFMDNGWESDIFLDTGNDNLTLTSGKNLYLHGGDGTDNIDFTEGNVSYKGTEDGYYKFNTSEGDVFVGLDVERVNIKDEPVNLLEKFGGILGTRGNDDIDGTNKDDLIDALEGDDSIRGVSGNDVMYGYFGNDTLKGGAGSDEVYGDDGNDELYGGKGNDFITGKSGKDKMYGDENNDTLLGMNGNDTIEGGSGKDYLKGGGGNDVMRGGKHLDTFALSLGKDTIKDYKAGELIVIMEKDLGSGIKYKNKSGNLLITTNEGINTTINKITKNDFLSAGDIEVV